MSLVNYSSFNMIGIKFSSFLPLVLMTLLAVVVNSTNYCAFKCGDKHLACNYYDKPTKCSKPAKYMPIGYLIDYILDMHNQQRNTVAGGIAQFTPAIRMPTLRWDSALAELAVMQALKCDSAYDKCHPTDAFQYSGQNNFALSFSGDPSGINAKSVIDKTKAWYLQNATATMDTIKSFSDSKVGHFTLIINDRNTHVGCGMAQFDRSGKTVVVLICNYATNNFKNKSTYKSGPVPGSGCNDMNPDYPNLCSIEEHIDPNLIE